MQRSQYIRIQCDRRLLCGHMWVREDRLERVRQKLRALGVTWKGAYPPVYNKRP